MLFIYLCYPHVFALWKSVRNCFSLTCCKNLCLSSLSVLEGLYAYFTVDNSRDKRVGHVRPQTTTVDAAKKSIGKAASREPEQRDDSVTSGAQATGRSMDLYSYMSRPSLSSKLITWISKSTLSYQDVHKNSSESFLKTRLDFLCKRTHTHLRPTRLLWRSHYLHVCGNNKTSTLTHWRPLLPFGYTYKASCARPG